MNIFVITCNLKVDDYIIEELKSRDLISFLVDQAGYSLVVRDSDNLYGEENIMRIKEELSFVESISIIKGIQKEQFLSTLYSNGEVSIEI